MAEHPPRLKSISLQTHVLDQMQHFYQRVIGLPLVNATAHAVSFAIGATLLEFSQVTDSFEPYYHFAFDIPENKIAQAQSWLKERVTILRHAQSGDEIIAFPEWNAHALYFYDPSGNLVELIARHNVPNARDGAFDVDNLLYISEIGLVPDDQAGVFATLRDTFALAPYLNTASFLGDESGLIIVIPKAIRWIPEYKKSGMLCPTKVTIVGRGEKTLKFADLPFEIVSIIGS